MADILKFPKQQTEQPADLDSLDALNDLLIRVELLLADYTAEQIILAMFEKLVEAEDIAALMPSFSVIVDKRDK